MDDMETITSEYFINGNNNTTEKMPYYVKYLKNKCKDIKEAYKPYTKTGKYNRVDVEKIVCLTRCKELNGEMWRLYPEKDFDGIGQIEVSNYGRIRLKDGEVLPLVESESKNPEIDDYYDGYLKVLIPSENSQYKLSSKKVYELVAETWLVKPSDKENLQIHHINNNGYENTPENLIYVSREDHKKIHGKG